MTYVYFAIAHVLLKKRIIDNARNIVTKYCTGQTANSSKDANSQGSIIISAELHIHKNNTANKYPFIGSLSIAAYNLLVK
jgi:hypothetical protein